MAKQLESELALTITLTTMFDKTTEEWVTVPPVLLYSLRTCKKFKLKSILYASHISFLVAVSLHSTAL